MKKRIITGALFAAFVTAGSAQADTVEIYLIDMLDNIQKGYCVDIAGGREADADPVDGLQGHTCYSPGGALGVDQTFSTEKFADNVLYMTEFDVCAQLASFDVGTKVDLATCDGSDAQTFVFSGSGQIVPASAPEICLTLGEDTRFGRSKENQIKDMTLQPCSDDKAAYQTWGTRSSVE